MSSLNRQKEWRESDRGILWKRQRGLEQYGITFEDDLELLGRAMEYLGA